MEMEQEFQFFVDPETSVDEDMDLEEGTERTLKVRLDKWLWAARFFKTRALARAAVEAGKVFYNGERSKPSREIEVGAILQVRQGRFEKTVIVKGLSTRRRSTDEALQLFEETEESKELREQFSAEFLSQPSYNQEYFANFPDQRERRSVRFLRRSFRNNDEKQQPERINYRGGRQQGSNEHTYNERPYYDDQPNYPNRANYDERSNFRERSQYNGRDHGRGEHPRYQNQGSYQNPHPYDNHIQKGNNLQHNDDYNDELDYEDERVPDVSNDSRPVYPEHRPPYQGGSHHSHRERSNYYNERHDRRERSNHHSGHHSNHHSNQYPNHPSHHPEQPYHQGQGQGQRTKREKSVREYIENEEFESFE